MDVVLATMSSPSSPQPRPTAKLGRNDPCWCNSGKKYKYCHFDADRDRLVTVDPALHPPGTPVQVNYKDDIINLTTILSAPIKRFCADHDFYFFGSTFTLGDLEVANKKLGDGSLTREHLIDACKKRLTSDIALAFVDDACRTFDSFYGRDKILKDAIEAHFAGKYTLSTPALFAQLEGILRKVGALEYRDTFKPTIKRDIWDNRLLFSMKDSAQFFNGYISRLYEGQKDDPFNRNTVLHGERTDYDTEENSLILLLCILEVRIFLWFEKNTKPLV
ncbi:SEC-C domain-containing protein [Methylobacterium sp.]|uniref:YecA family protein n=1 Tax=Methylobacterium sp. TaxID=409 RepID=UPI0017E8FB41|nr:SEC-C domain-containing protein [Methylobacterium sp.]